MLKHILRVLLILLVIVAGTATYLAWPDSARLGIAQVQGKHPLISAARTQILPTIEVADPVGWQPGQTPTAAPGLTVQAFARGLDHPRWLYRLPNGDVLVAETNSPPREGGGVAGLVMRHLMKKAGAAGPSPNRITLLRDADGDGVAETRTVFMTGLNSPFGMALIGEQLYVANSDAVVRVPYTPGATTIAAKPELIVKLPGSGNHWARNLLVAPDGQHLYVTVGSSTNIADDGLDQERYRANILEVAPATKTLRIYASGLRNPNGMAINPVTHQLWTVVNERDMLGSDLAPDYLTQVELGDQFGWPWYYWGGYPDNRVEQTRPDLQEYSKRPDFALGPHVAALGLAFSDSVKLGGRFGSGAFIGEHGSWNRQPLSGYKVVYVPFGASGFPRAGARPIDVLTGFVDDKARARGRPVGVIADRTGAMLVADDVGNVVWRVTAQGGSRPRSADSSKRGQPSAG